MTEEVQTDELSISDVFKVLLSKIKVLILVLVIGAILGGVYGYLGAYGVEYYGTSLSFFVSPTVGSTSSTQPIALASADDDEDEDYTINGQYTPTVMSGIVEYLEGDVFAEKLVIDMGLFTQRPAADAPDSEWVQYKSSINRVKGAVSFRFYKSKELGANESRNYIYVTITVLKHKQFAEDLMESIQKTLPPTLIELLPRDKTYSGAKCIPMNIYPQVSLQNGGYVKSQTLKYAAVAGAVALVVACVVVVLVDMSDKRLRDYDVISKKFNVPVLGVIPTIEDALPDELKHKQQKTSKKKEDK